MAETGKYSREYLNMIKNDEYLFINFKTLFNGYNCYGCSKAISWHKSDPPPYRPNIGDIFSILEKKII